MEAETRAPLIRRRKRAPEPEPEPPLFDLEAESERLLRYEGDGDEGAVPPPREAPRTAPPPSISMLQVRLAAARQLLLATRLQTDLEVAVVALSDVQPADGDILALYRQANASAALTLEALGKIMWVSRPR